MVLVSSISFFGFQYWVGFKNPNHFLKEIQTQNRRFRLRFNFWVLLLSVFRFRFCLPSDTKVLFVFIKKPRPTSFHYAGQNTCNSWAFTVVCFFKNLISQKSLTVCFLVQQWNNRFKTLLHSQKKEPTHKKAPLHPHLRSIVLPSPRTGCRPHSSSTQLVSRRCTSNPSDCQHQVC